jgi:hypothetical protein
MPIILVLAQTQAASIPSVSIKAPLAVSKHIISCCGISYDIQPPVSLTFSPTNKTLSGINITEPEQVSITFDHDGSLRLSGTYKLK